jgi:AcrR family transcriptional regulator
MSALPEPTTTKGRATRARIVRAAVDLVGERGIGRMSLDDVLDRAAVSKGQLYHYFTGKDDLVRAAVAATVEEVLEVEAAPMSQLEDWPAIDAWIAHLVARQEEQGGRGGGRLAGLVGHLAETDEESRRMLVQAFDRWEGLLARGLEAMRDRGALDASCNPAELATASMAAMHGGLLLTQARRDPQQLAIALRGARAYLYSFARGGEA